MPREFQISSKNRFSGSEKDRYFLKIPKWQHKLVWENKRGKLFLMGYVYMGLKSSENIEIKHAFQSKAFFITVTLTTHVSLAPLTNSYISEVFKEFRSVTNKIARA